MYPMAGYGETVSFDNFAEIKELAESVFDDFNFPIAWSFYDGKEDSVYWEGDNETPTFTLTMLMPRKSQTFDWETENFNKDEVKEWLNTRVKKEVMRWYGWPWDTCDQPSGHDL